MSACVSVYVSLSVSNVSRTKSICPFLLSVCLFVSTVCLSGKLVRLYCLSVYLGKPVRLYCLSVYLGKPVRFYCLSTP